MADQKRPVVRFETGKLEIIRPDAETEFKNLDENDKELFNSWIRDYREILKKENRVEDLLSLGHDIYLWLDGDSGCMQKMLKHGCTPFLLEFAVKSRPDEDDLRFLEVPWEVLADDNLHLTHAPYVQFCPVRRIGQALASEKPSEYRLAAVFMAAAPRKGGVPLKYEEEESAVLNAAGHSGMDLLVEESGNLFLLAQTMAARNPVDVLHISCHGNSEPEPVLSLENEEGNRAGAKAADLARELGKNRPKLLFLSACMTSEPNQLLNSFSSSMIRLGVPAVLGWGGSVSDVEATRFASAMYRFLCLKQP